MSNQATYQVSAKHYDDVYAIAQSPRDLRFWCDLVREAEGPVLELACGTGRILIPAAQEGATLEGVERSEAMYAKLEQNVSALDSQIRERIQIHRGDMRSIRLNRQFGLILIPFRPFQHMHTLEDQIATLETAKAHLAPNGRLVFDVFFPRYDLLVKVGGEEILDHQWTSTSDPSLEIQRYFRRDRLNKLENYFEGVFIYRAFRGEELISEEVESLKMTYFTWPHLQLLARLAGLRIETAYGDYDRSPLSEESREIIPVMVG